MDEKLEQVADNIQKGSTWVRLVLMLGFFIALYVVSIVIFLVMSLVPAGTAPGNSAAAG